MVFLLLGCSNPAPAPSPPQPPAATPVKLTAPTPTPIAKTPGLAGIRERGKLSVAADPEAPPFLNRTKSGFEGFEYGIMQAIANAVGVPLTIVEGTFETLTEKVASGEADLAIGQVSPSTSYTGVAWSVSYLQYSLCLIVPKESPVKQLSELAGKRVGMYDDPVARQLADVLISATYEKVLFSDYGYFEKMVRGQLDAMVYDCPLARYEIKTYGDQLRIAQDALNITTYNVVISEQDIKLLAEVNEVIRGLGEQGLLANLEERWLGSKVSADSYESATGKVVVVKKGDTLSILAARELGSADRWKDLYSANKAVVGPDPNIIYTGMRLRMPR